jgi:hypothetical protein
MNACELPQSRNPSNGLALLQSVKGCACSHTLNVQCSSFIRSNDGALNVVLLQLTPCLQKRDILYYTNVPLMLGAVGGGGRYRQESDSSTSSNNDDAMVTLLKLYTASYDGRFEPCDM